MPRVSVLVAAYNAEATIEQALRSVVAQTFTDWEVIVGDDRSTDATADVAGAIDPRIRVVRAERNRGHAAPTRNMAARHATGDLLAFLDGDDRWEPAYLETLVRAKDSTPGAAVIACDALLADEDGVPDGRTYLGELGTRPGPVSLDDLLRGNPVYASALIDRAAFARVGGLDEALRGTDDYDLWIRIAESGGDILVLPQALAVYRIHASQLSARQRSMSMATAAVYRRALGRGRLSWRQRGTALRSLAVQTAIGVAPWLARLSRHSRERFT
jgi:GT2 family glycosyltransferase